MPTYFPEFKKYCQEKCLHYLKDEKCKAYPDGIPVDIFIEGHSEVRPDQKGDYVYKEKA